jgi:hypothetical protein
MARVACRVGGVLCVCERRVLERALAAECINASRLAECWVGISGSISKSERV